MEIKLHCKHFENGEEALNGERINEKYYKKVDKGDICVVLVNFEAFVLLWV